MFESLESRALLTGEASVAPESIALTHGNVVHAAPRGFVIAPVLSRSVDGVVRVELNGWKPVSVSKKRDYYVLSFYLSHTTAKALSTPSRTGDASVVIDRGDVVVSRAGPRGTKIAMMQTSGAGGSILNLAVRHAGVRRIIWPSADSDGSNHPPAPPGQTPSDPAPGVRDGSHEAWQAHFAQQIKTANKSKTSTAFLGDSHIERYPYYGQRSWKQQFPNALNLGVSGDSTRQLLARIQAGLFDTYKPTTLVMMFGTNNFNDPATGGTDAQIAAGIQTVIRELRKRLPDTRFVVISTLPRNTSARNERIEYVNAMTAAYARDNGTEFLDVYAHYIGDPIRRTLYFDETHLNATGYRLMTNSLVPLLRG